MGKGATIGDRMLTITAWEHPDNARQMMKEGTHKDAVSHFFKNVSAGGWTSVWSPERINPFWARCASCGQMEDSQTWTTCRCGAALPEAIPYW